MAAGALVISLDFELAWGSRTNADDWSRYAGFAKVRDVVTRLLEIFNRYEISATWATVGHLMLREQDCPDGKFNYELPAPKYPWFQGEWYDGIPKYGEPGAPCFYGADMVRQILENPVEQEIGCHTFSHAVIGDPACHADIARGEFAECQRIAQLWNLSLKSVVFPRNRVGHLSVLKELGYTNYRDSNSEWYWFGKSSEIGAARGPAFPAHHRMLRYLTMVLRFIDEKLRFTPPLPPVRRANELWAIPHSMFFPGMSGVSKFVSGEDRSARAIRGLYRAREQRRVFSLYTHPNNFLVGQDELIAAFDRICKEASRLRDKGDFLILTMGQLANELDEGKQLQWTAEAKPRR